MAKWIYNGEKFKSIPVNWDEFELDQCGNIRLNGYENTVRVSTEYGEMKLLVCNPKWGKCFALITLGWHGNGNSLKAYIEDVYTKKGYWVCAKSLELVIKRK